VRFHYLRDPLFLVCVGAYFVNRWVLKRIWDGGFLHEHFNDLICIPFWVPIMLWMQRTVGMRPRDDVPHAHEVVIPLLLWSWVFEFLLPANSYFSRWCTRDYLDIVYYALGALLAALFWTWWYASRPAHKPSVNHPVEDIWRTSNETKLRSTSGAKSAPLGQTTVPQTRSSVA
jgi:hypothetical protein